MLIHYIDYEGLLEINKEIIKNMGGKFAVINEGNLRYCVEIVKDVGNFESVTDTCAHKAAFYICCISTGHGLLDYNKRTAYQMAYVFLDLNGFTLRVVNADDVVTILRQVSSEQILVEDVKQWVTQHIKPNLL